MGEELGRRGVTRREAAVLSGVGDRLTNAEISAALGLSVRTVESHVSALLRKLGAANRRELGPWAPATANALLGPDHLPSLLESVRCRGPFVGRQEELGRLLACWTRASEGCPTVAVVHGEAGIGKSRLAAAFAGEIHERGGRVLLGICVDGPQEPYGPFAQVVSEDLADLTVPGSRRDVDTGPALVRLAPTPAAGRALIDPIGDDPDLVRNAMLAAIVEHLAAVAERRPLLVVIEDLHWASSGTLDALAHVARARSTASLMLLVTSRDERPFAAEELRMFLGELARLASVELMEMRGLGVSDAGRLIEAVGGALDAERAVEQTGGNPLFLGELARSGAGAHTLAALVAAHFAALNGGDLDVVDTAVVAGEQIDVNLVAAASNRPLADVLDVLERAEAAGVVGAGASPGRLAFTHDVFRSVREASLTANRRFRLHASVAEALARRELDPRRLSELATHACLAGPRFDPSVAADLAQRAGDAAAAATDQGSAATHYRRALDALDVLDPPDEGRRLRATVGLGAAMVMSGDDRGQAMLLDAAAVAERRADGIALASALCAMSAIPGGGLGDFGLGTEFQALAESALRLLPSDENTWRVRVQSALGVHLYFGGDDAGEELLRDAVRCARRLDDPVALGRALMSFRFCGGPRDGEQRIACGHELIELGDRTGLGLLSAVGRQQLWWCHRELGHRDEMDRWTAAAADRIRWPDCEQSSQDVAVALLDGDLDRAERCLRTLYDAARPVALTREYGDNARNGITATRGHRLPSSALEQMLSDVSSPIHVDVLTAVYAHQLACEGRTDLAAELLDQASRRAFVPRYAASRSWTAELCTWAEVAAIVGDHDAAGNLAAVLEPLAGQWADTGLLVSDTIDRARALAELARNCLVRTIEIASEAATASRRRRTPILLARELVVAAAAQQRAGHDEWRATLDEALAIARRTGAHIIDHDARLYIDEHAGLPPDPQSLTRRERDVIERVRTGETNAQIATALGISVATVRKHLENAYRRLDVSTRTAALARTAARPS